MSNRAQLEEATDAYNAGNIEHARELLKSLTAADPDDEYAWLWYAYVLDGYSKKAEVLGSYLSRHPESEEARKRLEIYTRKAAEELSAQLSGASQVGTQDLDDVPTTEGTSDLAAWQAATPISGKLGLARHDLLDLSNRNPLINYRLLKARGVEITDPDPERIFTLLVSNSKQQVAFRPRPEAEPERDDEEQDASGLDEDLPTVNGEPENGSPGRARHALQTVHPAKELDKRLLNTYYAARTYIEEQGVNVLFLAFGMLKWYEAADSETERLAPLVLVPVEITRTDVRSHFRLHYTDDDLGENLSLREKLRREFGIELPALPELDDFGLTSYLQQVATAVRKQKGWQVDAAAIALGFFSFATFLMHNDLLEDTWEGIQDITGHPLLQSMLDGGFHETQPAIPEDAFVDDLVNPVEAPYIVDADSSQLAALLEVSRGRNLVIQGPPGTGKSQTITNIIAQAVAQGQRVLFVAEKLAALEVVKRRLDEYGLGPACLELHSQKAHKRAVLTELAQTLERAQPPVPGATTDLNLLIQHRDRLNAYSSAVNTPIGASGVNPYQCYGHLLGLAKAFGDIRAPELGFAPMASWSAQAYQKQRSAVSELQTLIERIGLPTSHPFWGSDLPNVTPATQRLLPQLCSDGVTAIDAVVGVLDLLTAHIGIPRVHDRAASAPLGDLVRRVIEAPDLTGIDVKAPAWRSAASDIETGIRSAQRLAEIHAQYDDVLAPEAWEHPVEALKAVYAQHARKWWRYLNTSFRRAKQELTELFQQKPPRSLYEQQHIIEIIEAHQQLTTVVTAATPLLAGLYGEAWQGVDSDSLHLLAVADWLRALHEDVRQGTVASQTLTYVAEALNREFLRAQSAALQEALAAHKARLDAVLAELKLDETVRFGRPDAFLWLPYADQRQRLEQWASSVGRLQEMVVYNHQAKALCGANLQGVVAVADAWPEAGMHLVDLYDRTWYEGLLETAIRDRPELAIFDGETHTQCIEAFRQFDKLQFIYHRARLAEKHWKQLPSAEADGGQMGILRREIEKKRRHYPIRKLMQLSGNAIQGLKPVFMMSPLSIAMFLPPGSITFDLVVFDEASQVRPADAIGAILRGKQIVVTGDSKQLPPTNFFAHISEGDDGEEESITAEVESVLGLLSAQGAPQKMLNWHYRSRHASLITVSNYEFYQNRLVVFPSPDDSKADTGLIFHHLPDTYYDRGKSRANRDEAIQVARAVMHHARTRSDRTLGVAAFSMNQMNEIRTQLERLRRQDPSCEPFFSAVPHEPFFIKNLENVQGDERDVIFISIGYGKSADGHLTMNFGPLNREGGERRLNVLITRARYRCEVFSNLTADDIDLGRTKARGVVALKRYLKYAETRHLDIVTPTGRAADSPFEEDVAAVLRDRGYIVDHQVGSAGFFIDLAVKDEQRPGRYVIAIECDGATYHSARSARDRDRLRQDVLEGLGWRIHRVWSTDWFNRRERETEKLIAAVERAKAEPAFPPHPGPQPLPAPDAMAGPAGAATAQIEPEPRRRGRSRKSTPDPRKPAPSVPSPKPKAREAAVQVQPYRMSDLRIRYAVPLHEASPQTVATWVVKVVTTESPIHVDDLVRRIAHAAGAGRTGSRMQAAILSGIAHAERTGKVRRQGDFIWLATMKQAPIRDRSDLPTTARKLERIAPEEIVEAVIKVVGDAMGMQPQEIPAAACRLLGFGRASAEMEAIVDEVAQEAVRVGLLSPRGDFLVAEEPLVQA